MNINMRISFASVLILLSLGSCHSGKALSQQENDKTMVRPEFTAGPPTLVYKTKKDYSRNVPILLSEDRSRVLSYPAPQDFRNKDSYPAPLALKGGYLLDKRDIGLQVACLKHSYEEYATLDK